MNSRMNKIRATSAGYRLPNRTTGALISQSSISAYKHPPERTQNIRGETQNSDSHNSVKQDQVWRDFVRAERNGMKDWQKNWSFVMNYDQLGNLKAESPLPNNVPEVSDHLPNTSNQICGSRMYTPLGRELMRRDKLLTGRYRKCKQSPDMQPC
ncbi:hypothetical protein UPYG_G00230280 [Umbra pygmaea]|uniref:Uncharacterized protein n=1 Tax=Umbra pygmaea TaxID=75934 RepID=A0ABD0WIK7_UMBPY